MKTIVINTSNEAKNTKLDMLFKAPFDHNSLLWIDSGLPTLQESTLTIQQNLLKNADTVDKDYQLIVLVDLYAFPMGNDRKAVEVYRQLVERYIYCTLAEPLYKELNLIPQGICIFFVDSAKEIRGLDLNKLTDNIKVQEAQEADAVAQHEAQLNRSISGDDLTDELPTTTKAPKRRTDPEQILMNLFGWTENTRSDEFSWSLKASATSDEYLDFTRVFSETSFSIAKSHKTAKVLEIALRGVFAPREEWGLSCIGRFPVYTPICHISRENEQSKLEGFFCVFANIFTCVQEKALLSQVTMLNRDQIRTILVAALKKYKHFSAEENIKVEFEPIVKVFEQRFVILEKRKKEARGKSEFKDKTDEEVAELVMSAHKPIRTSPSNRKLSGLDRQFYALTEEIFGNYDPDVIRAQNNRIVKSCLEGLWNWRDKQTREKFRTIVDEAVSTGGNLTPTAEPAELKREAIAFLQEEYEVKRDELIDQVTDAENKLASNNNILLETKDLMLRYSDWMRKGMWSWISFVGALFTVFATVYPFFYTEYTIGHTGLGFHMNLLAIAGVCAFLYALAAAIYIGYITRKKLALVQELGELRIKSEEDRKASIIALYRYYNDTIVEAESHSLLWQEILRRDQENAKKGIKRNSHIKQLKELARQVERFITMLKLDVPRNVTPDAQDVAMYAQLRLQINGEESYYQQDNQRVYCLLPEKDIPQPQKGDTEEV